MITSSLLIAVAQFSALNEPIVTVPFVNRAPSGVPITPEEPTTIALALVGIGIMAAYIWVQRILRPQRERSQKSFPPVSADVTRIGTPTRGAA